LHGDIVAGKGVPGRDRLGKVLRAAAITSALRDGQTVVLAEHDQDEFEIAEYEAKGHRGHWHLGSGAGPDDREARLLVGRLTDAFTRAGWVHRLELDAPKGEEILGGPSGSEAPA
jgi:hypothetical protein